MDIAIQAHNQRPAAVWSSSEQDYDQISRGISDSIDHCVMRPEPKPGERILDLATGTGWTSRVVARRGARVTGVDIASEQVATARLAETFSTGYGPTRALAASLDEGRRAQLRRDFIAFHDSFATELGICVPREYWVTVGVRK